jgi:hypothetical protein
MTTRLTDQLLQSYSSWAWLTDNSTKGRRYVATKMSGTACEIGQRRSSEIALLELTRARNRHDPLAKKDVSGSSWIRAIFTRRRIVVSGRHARTWKFDHCSHQEASLSLRAIVLSRLRSKRSGARRQMTPMDNRVGRGNVKRACTNRLQIDITWSDPDKTF